MSESPMAPRRPGGRGSDVGRPRDPGTDRSILRATIELLAEVGYARLTVAEVARQAGVSKPAIYRRWSQKSQLVVEAMVTQMRPARSSATGNAAGDLLFLTEQLIDILTRTPLGRVLPGLVAEMAADPVLATSYRELIIEPNQLDWRSAVERGIASGELAADTDTDFVLNSLAGPLYFSLLITGAPIEPGYARAAVDLVLARFGMGPGE
ncbi:MULTISPECIES: TetR/AcrR family transcriptional regulator [unclassified Cryobacterium]|uniref:TetR/AcrR family transcriptional regulator n=1 Tax=unclassified Cryobacterium TaxID=2649013 RepID=UPI00106CBE1F|nr:MULTISPECIES: TetR/AcrR family transcriptional regulator [unclassified Cryobacterium]TFC00943.1 TetR/AcrR family transcriptional regulator [Cryobacterium sp. MDB2-A-1]TFC13123.1 TetR/AcrR family transcriptional regulator [Cryobacterium sp. MDB2-A-2]TFC23933.1 TetR/AcrR family transcriptional regulator [Cryobacterium sp. MDB2-10]